MEKEELIGKYAAGERNFRNLILDSGEFGYLNLSDTDFSGSRMNSYTVEV